MRCAGQWQGFPTFCLSLHSSSKVSVLATADDGPPTRVRTLASSVEHMSRQQQCFKYQMTDDLAPTVACSIVASRLDYCNAIIFGAPSATFDTLQRAQNNLARVVCQRGVDQMPVHYSSRFTVCQSGNGSATRWCRWHSKCGRPRRQHTRAT